MPPQNILISLRCAPLHQDILHRGLDKRQYSIYTEKGKRATELPLSAQSHFSAVDDFTEIFSQSRIASVENRLKYYSNPIAQDYRQSQVLCKLYVDCTVDTNEHKYGRGERPI